MIYREIWLTVQEKHCDWQLGETPGVGRKLTATVVEGNWNVLKGVAAKLLGDLLS